MYFGTYFSDRWGKSVLGDNPAGVHDTGYIAEDGQQDIEPEVLAKPYLEKNAKRR